MLTTPPIKPEPHVVFCLNVYTCQRIRLNSVILHCAAPPEAVLFALIGPRDSRCSS